MARVCKNNGKILLLEHGKSNVDQIAKLQSSRAAKDCDQLGCFNNRDIVAIVSDASRTPILLEQERGVHHGPTNTAASKAPRKDRPADLQVLDYERAGKLGTLFLFEIRVVKSN